MSGASPLDGLDPALTAPKRLAAMALLSRVDRRRLRGAARPSRRERVGSLQADVGLAAAGYVTARKSGHGRGSATTYRATREGKRAYARHRAALEAILDGGVSPS